MSPSEIAQFIVWLADEMGTCRERGKAQDRVSTLYGAWTDVGAEITKHMIRIREEEKGNAKKTC